jgi:hypothetical protein
VGERREERRKERERKKEEEKREKGKREKRRTRRGSSRTRRGSPLSSRLIRGFRDQRFLFSVCWREGNEEEKEGKGEEKGNASTN